MRSAGIEATVVNVLSLSFTGTTWINMLLGSHEKALTIGPPDEFWKALKESSGNMCRVHGADCEFWPRFCQTYKRDENFFVQVARASGKPYIVINNPARDGMGRELRHDNVVARAICITRDGRAVSASYYRKYGLRQGMSYTDTLENWYLPAVRRFTGKEYFTQHTHYKYEDILADPEAALAKLGSIVGLDYSLGAPDYWRFDHHLISGNHSAICLLKKLKGLHVPALPDDDFYETQYAQMTSGGQRFADERWKCELSPEELDMFDRLCGRYNERMGYTRDTFSGGGDTLAGSI